MASPTNVVDILVQIFDGYPTLTEDIDCTDFTLKDHVKELTAWLNAQIQDEEDPADVTLALFGSGCMGGDVKVFDINSESAHTVNVSKDMLTVQSQSAFSTIKANCCAFRGKFMYEVQLRSKGIMQIGFCSVKCKFTQDTGVGDTRNSYGLDGSKQRLWHVQTRKYGPYWRSGDVIGVCLDMDAGTIEYHRNGKALGEAFTNIERGGGFALFPGVSMAYNDSLTANFGGSPFRHPVKGFDPFQARPNVALRNADYLLQRTIALAQEISMSRGKEVVAPIAGTPSVAAVHMVVGGVLIGHLSKLLLNTYVIEELVFSYIKSLCVMRSVSSTDKLVYSGAPQSTLGTFLTLLWAYLEVKHMKSFVGRFVQFLSSMYRETPSNLEYEKQRTVIVILTCLCHHPKTRKYLLEFRLFKKNFYNLPVFLYIKPPDESTLAELLPDDHVWTEGIGGKKNLYMAGCLKLKKSTDALYALQKHFVEILFNNEDHESGCTPTSLRVFSFKMRQYVLENCLEHRQSADFLNSNRGTPQPAVALAFICIVLDVLSDNYNKLREDGVGAGFVRPLLFYDGTLYYSFYERLGGVVSHLSKVFNQELLDRIGEDAVVAVMAGAEARPIVPTDIYSAMFVITGGSDSNITLTDEAPASPSNNAVGLYVEPHSRRAHAFEPVREMSTGPIDRLHAMDDLLDSCVMFYYGVAHKYIIMIAELRDNIGTLSDILIETKTAFEDVKKTIAASGRSDAGLNEVQDEILKELNEKFDNRKNVFQQRSIELARKQVWYRAVALGDRRQNLLQWMLNSVFNTLAEATKDGALFAFVPEIYVNILPILLDTCLDFSHHDLAREYDQSAIVDLLKVGAEFLGGHSADPRIVLASSKDALLQALGTMACHETGVRTLEKISHASQLTLVHGLLRPYENRAWGQSNWMLNRFWMGEGFAYRDVRAPSMWQSGIQQTPHGLLRSRGKIGAHTGLLHHVAPACPSKHYHELIADVLENDEPFSTIFVNSILSQLNWAFSEFVQLLQEIQNNVQRHDQRHFSESRQLKICSMCFELTVSLMRSLEMLLTIVPCVFKDQQRANSDLLLNRVCQLISQVLARVTVPPGVFQFVIDLCLPDLSTITHFAIVSAAIGILMAMLYDEMKPSQWSSSEALIKVPRITRILLSDPSFQLAHLQFTMGELAEPPMEKVKLTLKGNFDPQTRVNIDPLTNEVRVVSSRLKKPDKPIVKFNLQDYTTHVSAQEIFTVNRLIDFLNRHQSLMSETTLPSDDTICPICYAKSVSAIFEPCKHQSCANCIVQHLMNNKLCFYCKTHITSVLNFDGVSIYDHVNMLPPLPTEAE